MTQHARAVGAFLRPRLGPLVLLALLAFVTALKLHLVLSGPDTDPDAYAHAIAGRRMIETLGDLTAHWVWLPGFHAVYALATLLGGGIQQVRCLNVALSSLAPLLLLWLLNNGHAGFLKTEVGRNLPWVAACLLALDPLCVWLGETGQMESLFQVVVLAACLLWDRQRPLLCALCVSVAVSLRYEAWLLPWVFLLLAIAQRPRSLARFAVAGAPALLILLWIWVHFRASGEPLQFLRFNAEFARGYLEGIGFPWGKTSSPWRAARWYWVTIPFFWSYHWAYVLSLPGWIWWLRHGIASLRWTSLSLLGFLTAGLMMGQHLGLPRHAVVTAPLVASAMACGWLLALHATICHLGAWGRARTPTLSAVAIGLLLVWMAGARAFPRYRALLEDQHSAFVEERRAASVLRQHHNVARVFCDRSVVEVLSALPPGRFIRWNLPDVTADALEQGNTWGEALVVSSPERVRHLAGVTDTVLAGKSIVVLRYTGAP